MPDIQFNVTDQHIAGVRSDMQAMPKYGANAPHGPGLWAGNVASKYAEQVIANSGPQVGAEYKRLNDIANDPRLLASSNKAEQDRQGDASIAAAEMRHAAMRAILKRDPTLGTDFPLLRAAAAPIQKSEATGSVKAAMKTPSRERSFRPFA
jgi:hypothetical protein